MTLTTLLTVFVVCSIFEYVAFGLQRTALLISRQSGMSKEQIYLLLPVWFPLVWLVILVKWAVAGLILWKFGWRPVLIIVYTSYLLSSVLLPIPYNLYRSYLKNRGTKTMQVAPERMGEIIQAEWVVKDARLETVSEQLLLLYATSRGLKLIIGYLVITALIAYLCIQ
jgi:hypothetical protein